MEAVHHDDRRAAELLGEQGDLDVGTVLVAVADDQRVGVVHGRQDREQLGLAAGLETDAERPPEVDDLLHDVALLVHLDRVDRPVTAPILVLLDRRGEALAERADAGGEDVGEADQHRHVEPAPLEVVDQVLQVDGRAARSPRADLDAAGRVDRDEARAPAVDLVQIDRILNLPSGHRRPYTSARAAGATRSPRRRRGRPARLAVRQSMTSGRYSPKTFRMASEISPSVQ